MRDRDAAERFLNRMLAPMGLGEKMLPLGEAWRAYEVAPNRGDPAPSTLAAKRLVWMHFAAWIEKNHREIVKLAQLTREVVAEYLAELRVGHCGSTYNGRVCILREVCRVLSDKAGCVDDPWEGVCLRNDDSHSRREFSLDELRRVLDAAEKEGPEWHRLFSIGLYTGLRLGDCCLMNWSEVNLTHGIIQVLPRKTRKHLHGRPVTIPIDAAVRGGAAGDCRVVREGARTDFERAQPDLQAREHHDQHQNRGAADAHARRHVPFASAYVCQPERECGRAAAGGAVDRRTLLDRDDAALLPRKRGG